MIYVLALLLTLLIGCGEDTLSTPATQPPSAIQVEDSATAVTVRSAAAAVRIDKATARLTLQDAAGTQLTESAAPPTLLLGTTPQPLQTVRAVSRTENGAELTCDAGDRSVLWT